MAVVGENSPGFFEVNAAANVLRVRGVGRRSHHERSDIGGRPRPAVTRDDVGDDLLVRAVPRCGRLLT